MVKEFINEIRDDMIIQKSSIENSIVDIENSLKENKKFLEVLMKDKDDIFTEFSPRDVNHRNQEQIDKLEIKINQDEKKVEDYREKLDKLNCKINDADKALIELEVLQK